MKISNKKFPRLPPIVCVSLSAFFFIWHLNGQCLFSLTKNGFSALTLLLCFRCIPMGNDGLFDCIVRNGMKVIIQRGETNFMDHGIQISIWNRKRRNLM